MNKVSAQENNMIILNDWLLDNGADAGIINEADIYRIKATIRRMPDKRTSIKSKKTVQKFTRGKKS